MSDITAEFEDRVAIITGGARGMGAAAAEHLLKNGGAVSLWDMNMEALNSTHRRLSKFGHVQILSVDVSDETSVAAGMASCIKEFGKVDILVNCAGIAGVNAPVETFPLDVWRKVMDVNLTGMFLVCQAVIPHMRKSGYGRIVNLASVAGKEGNPNASAYSVSKAGLIGLTKSLGKELATDGITVNVITPAVIKTEMLADVEQSQIDYMVSKIPMGRTGTVEEVAQMIAFLASDRAAFSTAAVFDMSGGRSTY